MKEIKLPKSIMIVMIIMIVLLILLALAINNIGTIASSSNIQKEEKAKIALTTSEAYLLGAGTITKKNLETRLDLNFGLGEYLLDNLNDEYFEITIIKTGREYIVYKNGKIEVILETVEENVENN